MNNNRYFIGILQNRGNALINLQEYLRRDKGDGYKRVAALINKNPQLNAVIGQSFFPKRMSRSYPYYLNYLNIDKILLWFCCLISLNKEAIHRFEECKSTYEKNILSGNYEIAYDIAKDIQRDFGMSMWLLDAYGILDTFSPDKYEIYKELDEDTLHSYNMLSVKNVLGERQTQYIHRINHLLSKTDDQFSSYCKYKLFSQLPQEQKEKTKEHWKNVLIMEGGCSLIDIYLVTIDCLHYYTSSYGETEINCLEKCISWLSEVDTPMCKIMCSEFRGEANEDSTQFDTNKYIQLIKEEKFEDLVDYFYTLGFEDYDNFSAYRYTAIAGLHSALPSIDASPLFVEILECVYQIMKKEDYHSVDEANSKLRILSRILRSFTINKGICVFLNVSLSMEHKYRISQQMCTYGDQVLTDYEFAEDNIYLLPYRDLFYEEDDLETRRKHITMYENRIESGVAVNYYEAARIKTLIHIMCSEGNYIEAIRLFVLSYVNNPFLIYTVDIRDIEKYLMTKIRKEEDIGLEELCYIFIDGKFKEYRKSCYLNYLNCELEDEPLKIIESSKYHPAMIDFFLAKICTREMLTEIYLLFDASDDVKDYRMEICQYLYTQKRRYAKEAQEEHRELAKNKAMRQKLIHVDRSRVSIDTRSIQDEVYEEIEYQMDACNSQRTDAFSSQGKESYVILRPQTDLYLCMYETYAKAFCFGTNGLDTSLSTRVRHGAFINQIFRTFDENALIYTDGGKNNLFDPMFKAGTLSQDIRPILCQLHAEIRERLEYFTQHTLKVFIDEPIDGAVFDYSVASLDVAELSAKFIVKFWAGKYNDANVPIQILHELLIQKTNYYLSIIRDTCLPELERSLLSLLDAFSTECGKYALNITAKQEIQRKISQCETALQNEIKTVASWFYLSEYEVWEEYTFIELIDMCIEITKKLFSEFGQVNINKFVDAPKICSGSTFRSNTDILLILLNNCFSHSGFDDHPKDLEINCTLQEKDGFVWLYVENNLSDSIDIAKVSEKVDKINNDYLEEAYKHINTRQEGGMGLYKIMLILDHTMRSKDSFYITLNEHKVKVAIKLRKEIIYDPKDSFSR